MPTSLEDQIFDHFISGIYKPLFPFENPLENVTHFNMKDGQEIIKNYLKSDEYQAQINAIRAQGYKVNLIPVTSKSTFSDFHAARIDQGTIYFMTLIEDNGSGPTFYHVEYPSDQNEPDDEALLDLDELNAQVAVYKQNFELCQKLSSDQSPYLRDVTTLSRAIFNRDKTHRLEELANLIHTFNATWGSLLPSKLILEISEKRVEAYLHSTNINYNLELPDLTVEVRSQFINLDLSNIPDSHQCSTITITTPTPPTKKPSSWLTRCGLFGLGVASLSFYALAAYNQTMQGENNTRQITP